MTRQTSPMQRVIISGLPRSGTSWTGKALSFAPGFTYYREPDNSEFVPGAPGRDYWNLYLRAGDEHPIYGPHMERALSGKVVNNFVMYDDYGPIVSRIPQPLRFVADYCPALYRRQPNAVVKLIRSSLALDWIAGRFPEARIVSLVRHPVGQFESYRKQGWEPADPASLLEDERLVADHLAPFADVIRSARTFWERAGTFWGAVNRVVYRQAQAGGAHSVVPFEWLCADAPVRMKDLSNRLGLGWTLRSHAFVAPRKTGVDGDPYSLDRDTRAQIDKWRQTVSQRDIDACRAFAEPFGLPVYEDFDPWQAQALWSARMPATAGQVTP